MLEPGTPSTLPDAVGLGAPGLHEGLGATSSVIPDFFDILETQTPAFDMTLSPCAQA